MNERTIVLSWPALALALASCSPTLPPPDVKAPPPEAHQTEQAQLLLYPESNAEGLLGRAVQKGADGSWTIADARAPGCDVTVRHEAAKYHAVRHVAAHSLTTLAGGYAKLVSLEAKFGNSNTADIDVTNVEILRADTRGACGERIVDTVFVGHGQRDIKGDASESGKADVQVGVVSASPNVEAANQLQDQLAWSDDEAYGFSTRDNAKSEPMDLRVYLPSIVTEGDDVRLKVDASQPAWLVVYYIDGSGHADVLWPSNEEPDPRVAPGASTYLPTDGELAQGFHIRAALGTPGKPSRETLVTYAFADKGDFDALRPAANGESTDGPAFASELTKKLQNVPTARWSRSVVGYVIQPRR